MNIKYSDIIDRLKKLANGKTCLRLSIFLLIGIMCGTTIRVINDRHEYRVRREIETRAFSVYFGDKEIGKVRDQNSAQKLVKDIKKIIKTDYNCDIVINQKLRFEDIHVEDEEITTTAQLKKEILDVLSFNVKAYAIKINGKVVGHVKTKEVANRLLGEIKQPYIDRIKEQDGELEKIDFLEKTEIVEVEQSLSKLMDYDDLLNYIKKGTTQEKTHVVQKGDSLWSISKDYDISIKDLEKANPQYVNGYLQINDELSLTVPKPFITVVTKEKAKLIEKVGFDTEYQESSSLYKDETRVKRKGVYGEREIVALVEKHNNVEMKKEVLQESIISQPKAQIVIRGTKAIPALAGTGVFQRPTRGMLTSRYGPRWGGFHRGIDLASGIGTPIKAADSGTVIFTGYSKSYGYWVEISHGGGYSTRYAHCSKIYVKKGQKVYKDKTIAAVGNTGNSKGPHVHFEILKYGKTQNPLSVLGKKYR
ncbi:M23 family metallopeptidase [Clostridiaceae bacterium M8S5]|nr:M23 family metallopeptidase [Clostridiaceae bacterium M8S5]